MDVVVRPAAREAYEPLSEAAPGLSLLQCWAYGSAKAQVGPWRAERWLLEAGGRPAGLAQVLVRDLPLIGGGLAWVNRGPLLLDRDAVPWSRLAKALHRQYAPRGYHLRIAPPFEHGGVPAGFVATDTPGWASAVLDLDPDEAALRKDLAQKWRNCLNKGEREGVAVHTGVSGPLLEQFVGQYRAFLAERGLETTVTPDLLRCLDRESDGTKLTVFMATGPSLESLGGILVVRYGDTAEYLAGTVGETGRRLNAGQVLLWRAVVAMKNAGLRRFDLGGMDADLTPPGIYRFKQGLGGTPYRLAPEIEATGGGLRARMVRWKVARARAVAGPGA